MAYTLYHAPDNASLIIRLALENAEIPYHTSLVDRGAKEEKSAAYLQLNPHGLIPALDTPDGAIFETGAILLWLADRHGGLAPAPDDADRGDFLKWLFYISNTLHPALRMLFYPHAYVDGEAAAQALTAKTKASMATCLDRIEVLLDDNPRWLGAPQPGALDGYLACCLRWLALYPRSECAWFALERWPRLRAFAKRRDGDPATRRPIADDGLGEAPFSAPDYPNPRKGSAT